MDSSKVDLPLPILTPRLRLSPPQSGDGRAINDAIMTNIEDIAKWMPWANPPPDVHESEQYARSSAKDFIHRKMLVMLIWNRHTGELLGSSGFHDVNWGVPSFEIGYWLGSKATGRGYAVEAVNALTRYAFQQLGARRVAIHCDTDNHKSRAIPEKLGFNLEGLLRNDRLKADGREPQDTHIFSRIDLSDLPTLDVHW